VVKRVTGGSAEAAALLAIEHPNIVRLMDVRGDALVFERAAGGSLHELLDARGRLAAGEVVTVGLAIADALGEVHRRGLAHGDVHPGNILFSDEMLPLLADFGSTSAVGGGAPVAYGAAGFAAPEVERRHAPSPASPHSDQWSLGATLRAAIGPIVPTPLAVVLAVALAPEPADRFPNMAAMATALSCAAAPARVRPAPPSKRRSQRPSKGPTSAPVTRRFGPRPPVTSSGRGIRRPTPLAIAVIAVLAVLAGAGVARLRPSLDGPPAPVTANEPPSPPVCPAREVGAAAPTTLPGDRVVVGCSVTALQRGNELLVTLDGVAHRYLIGDPTDVVLLGDWDCDGTDTPALYDPETGRVLAFGSWNANEDPVASAPLAPNGEPSVTRRDGCDTVAIH
jgi:serine/threonine protein kinase